MGNIIYAVLVLIVALTGIIVGFRRGITGQIATLLGFSFGAVSARVLTPRFSHVFENFAATISDPQYVSFVSNLLCAIFIYSIVFALFCIPSKILQGALSIFDKGMFNRLVGAFFSLVCSLLWLSMALNLFLCLSTESGLMHYEKSDDGNMVAAVMALTPAILGCYGADDFAHHVQLQKAATISCNFNHIENVILKKG